MDTTGAQDAMYGRLLALNQEAFSAKLYEIAYHALAGALHRAVYLRDDALLDAVAALATAQLWHIDLHAPTQALSSFVATSRGRRSAYAALAQLATTCARLIRHDRGRRQPWPADSDERD